MSNPSPPIAQQVLQAYATRHGHAATVIASAPGRVNLIGEHTDYNDGFVLPIAIDRYTWVAAGPRPDGEVHVTALDWQAETDTFVLDALPPHHPGGGWRDHVRGTLAQWFSATGSAPARGMNLVIAGDVPQGAGLSSSASLALALLHAAQALHPGTDLTPTRLAQLAQQAENQFVGCNCGIMDQLASACGQAGQALLIDCRSLSVQAVPIPQGSTLVIAHSRVRRGLVDSAYNERRRQCESAARFLRVNALRDAKPADLEATKAAMPRLPFARARHVVTENARVLEAAQALRDGKLPRLGRLMADSHASMHHDFEITVPAVDELAALLQHAAGEHGGARMTGGGFGGCVVALMPEDRVPIALALVERHYRSPSGEAAEFHLCSAAAGAQAQRMAA